MGTDLNTQFVPFPDVAMVPVSPVTTIMSPVQITEWSAFILGMGFRKVQATWASTPVYMPETSNAVKASLVKFRIVPLSVRGA
jgi:hypothetical protein